MARAKKSRNEMTETESTGGIGRPMREVKTPAAGTKIVDRNLMGVNPTKEQFEPTDASPIPQRFKMAGGG